MSIKVLDKDTKIKDIDLLELAESITYNINNGYTLDAIRELKDFSAVIKNELAENTITAYDGNSEFQVVSSESINVIFEYIETLN
jgi:hypothetical protein